MGGYNMVMLCRMPPRRRARVHIPDTAGLYREGQQVGEYVGDGVFPPSPIIKNWADSFADPENGRSSEALDGPDYWFKAEVSTVDFDVHFRLGITEEGALVITGLLLGDAAGTQPITTSNLHKLSIGAIYDGISILDDVTNALAQKARKFDGEVPSRGGQKTPEEEFTQVAELYKSCLIERPNDPIKCVAEKLGVSSATASRRVSRARDLGLLSRERIVDAQRREAGDESQIEALQKQIDEIKGKRADRTNEIAEGEQLF